MSKPGRDARVRMPGIANGGVDLAAAKMRANLTDEEVRLAQEMVELSQGLRCDGCGRRISRGFHFVSIGVKEEKTIVKLAACSREDCDYAVRCRSGATYVEQMEWVWLDEAGADAPAAQMITERNETRAARADAAAEQLRAAERLREGRAEQSAGE